jgi:hypothetical protein
LWLSALVEVIGEVDGAEAEPTGIDAPVCVETACDGGGGDQGECRALQPDRCGPQLRGVAQSLDVPQYVVRIV